MFIFLLLCSNYVPAVANRFGNNIWLAPSNYAGIGGMSPCMIDSWVLQVLSSSLMTSGFPNYGFWINPSCPLTFDFWWVTYASKPVPSPLTFISLPILIWDRAWCIIIVYLRSHSSLDVNRFLTYPSHSCVAVNCSDLILEGVNAMLWAEEVDTLIEESKILFWDWLKKLVV